MADTATESAAGEKTVTLTIDGQPTVPEKTTIWEAAAWPGITIPALCHKEDLNPVAVCRVCVVDVLDNGGGGRAEGLLPASCSRECVDKMKILTTSQRAETDAQDAGGDAAGRASASLAAGTPAIMTARPGSARREVPDHRADLHAAQLLQGQRPVQLFHRHRPHACILCDRCVRACTDVAGNEVIGRMGKGNLTSISFDDNKPMGSSSCVNCGWCMVSCPTGAITYSGGVGATLPVGQPLAVEEGRSSSPSLPRFPAIFGAMLGRVVRREYKKGEVICRQGEFGSTAYYIISGTVDIFLETDMNHVRTKTEGGLFKKVTSLLRLRGSDKREEEGEKRYIPIDGSVDLAYDKPIAQVGEGELMGEAACINMQPLGDSEGGQRQSCRAGDAAERAGYSAPPEGLPSRHG